MKMLNCCLKYEKSYITISYPDGAVDVVNPQCTGLIVVKTSLLGNRNPSRKGGETGGDVDRL